MGQSEVYQILLDNKGKKMSAKIIQDIYNKKFMDINLKKIQIALKKLSLSNFIKKNSSAYFAEFTLFWVEENENESI